MDVSACQRQACENCEKVRTLQECSVAPWVGVLRKAGMCALRTCVPVFFCVFCMCVLCVCVCVLCVCVLSVCFVCVCMCV
jgi:hypothetical protein